MDYNEYSSEFGWLECFVDPSVITRGIADPDKRKQLPRLCMQFSDKGFLAEREKDKGNLTVEDQMLFDRKAASMRLCAMATVAALDYDIEFIIDNINKNELQSLRMLADNFYKVYNEKNLDATFGNWLFYRFVLSIDRRYRLPPPPPAATIASTLANGQLMPSDPALIKHEKMLKTIQETREHVLKARAFITELSEEKRDVVAPGVQSFLKPFVEVAPKSMSAALLGDRDVLIPNPSPDFETDTTVLPADDVANKCLSELVQFLFTAGDLQEARKILQKVRRPTSTHPMVAIDEEVFKAYSMILSVKTEFLGPSMSTVIRPLVFDQKMLSEENSEFRKSELYRYRGATETNGQLQQVYQVENAAMSLIEGHPVTIREHLQDKKALLERFVKVLKRRIDGGALSRCSPKKRALIWSHLHFLCLAVKDMKEQLELAGIDVSALPGMLSRPMGAAVHPAPRMEQLRGLYCCPDPFWTLMTEFDIGVLGQCITALIPFWYPNTLQVSESLSLFLDPNHPQHTLQRIVLTKLEQLRRVGNSESFLSHLQQFVADFGPANPQWITLALCESIHDHVAIGNQQCLLPFRKNVLNVQLDRAELIFKPDFVLTESSEKMVNECIALLLNCGREKMVLEQGGNLPIETFKCVPIARILGAYLENYKKSDTDAQKKCADGMWRTVTQKLIEAQPRSPSRRGESTAGEARVSVARKYVSVLFHLFELIRQPQLVEFILAYAVCLNNKLMGMQKRATWTIYAKELALFAPESNSPKLEITNNDDIRQLLRTTVENAYALSRTDPHTIRTLADYLYSERDWQGAGQKYMEYFAAYSPTFRLNSQDSAIFDENVLHRLRICLCHSGYLTMAMLSIQWVKNQAVKTAEYKKAFAMLRSNETRDAGANCADFVIEVTVVEMLSEIYHAGRMTRSFQTLYTGAASLSMNKNCGLFLNQQEVNRRTCNFLTCLASIYFGVHV